MEGSKEYIIYFFGSEDEFYGLQSFYSLEKFKSYLRHIPLLDDLDNLAQAADAILVSEDFIMDGLYFMDKVKQCPYLKDAPVISILTQAHAKEVHNLHVDNFICPPFTVDELYLRITHTISYLASLKKLEEQRQKINYSFHKLRKRTIDLFGKHIDLKKAKKEIVIKNKRIQHQHNEIQASIRYASLIQNAILPRQEDINKILKEYFLINIPKAIVSGDFYWIGEKDGRICLIVADCTGHGVPGAFMSILGTGAINEIMKSEQGYRANEILGKLRDYIINILHQKGDFGEANDSMDMCLCMIDYKTHTIEYAGAHNPLYHVHNHEMNFYKADHMTLGINRKAIVRDFTNHIIPFTEGDLIYLFSDGYADQFGGPAGSKFRYSNFREFLFLHHELSMEQQQEALQQELTVWKGDYEQIDDILILGVKL